MSIDSLFEVLDPGYLPLQWREAVVALYMHAASAMVMHHSSHGMIHSRGKELRGIMTASGATSRTFWLARPSPTLWGNGPTVRVCESVELND